MSLLTSEGDYTLLTDKNLIRISVVFAFALAFLFFSIIFSLTFMMEKKGEGNCVERLSMDPVFELGRAVQSKAMAEKVITLYAMGNKSGANIRYLRDGLEQCGPGFVFIDKNDSAKYTVCENGNVYPYVSVCQP